MIRTFFIAAFTCVCTFVLGIATIISSFFTRTGNFPHLIARAWANAILFVSGVRVTVTGVSHIDPDKSYIYMPNHQGNFDIPVLLGRLPVQFRWLAKEEVFRIPIMGRGMRACGYISIDRSDRQSAFKSLERAVETIRDGTSVVIFPEGTRSVDGKLKSFKKGGFVIAADAGVPIVPVAIHDTWEIMPKKRFLIKPRDVLLEIRAPVDTTGYSRETKNELMEKIRRIIKERLDRGREKTS